MYRNSMLSKLIQIRHFATLSKKYAPKITPEELYEPKFENKKEYPEYERELSIRLQGYDFVPLEKYQSYVHNIAKKFNFQVNESYAVTAKKECVRTFKHNSAITLSKLNSLFTYDRWIRICNVPYVRLPLFLMLVQTHLPISVKMTVKEFEKADETYRYIPDLILKEKRDELRSLDDPNVRKMLGWE